VLSLVVSLGVVSSREEVGGATLVVAACVAVGSALRSRHRVFD
tara:strand:+ start:660 stop:788 length:129 start_codon:yes stop_codon:yes gene_type:complete